MSAVREAKQLAESAGLSLQAIEIPELALKNSIFNH
jgi:hypothetical protein